MVKLLHQSGAALFDFDGPVCSVFAGYSAPAVAAHMISVLRAQASGVLSPEVATETDPMEVLRWVDRNMKNLVTLMEDALCKAEETAIESAAPAPSSHLAIEAAKRRGQATAIVSNNSSTAIEKYLKRYGLTNFVDVVVGRPYANPEGMKPNPQILVEALDALGVKPENSFLVGDSVTDVQACLRADVWPVGYAKDAIRHLELIEAGAIIVIDDMGEFLRA